MKKLIAILVVALAIPTMSYAGGEGRYQMLKSEARLTVWVLDTKTGMLRTCTIPLLKYDNGQSKNTIDSNESPFCNKKVDASK